MRHESYCLNALFQILYIFNLVHINLLLNFYTLYFSTAKIFRSKSVQKKFRIM